MDFSQAFIGLITSTIYTLCGIGEEMAEYSLMLRSEWEAECQHQQFS